MRPLDRLPKVAPDTPITVEIMSREDVNELPVVGEGHIEGSITRGGLLRLLQTRGARHVRNGCLVPNQASSRKNNRRR
jgi:hypothetical protein